MREVFVALLALVLLATISCASTTPLPSHDVDIGWTGATMEGGEDFPPEYEVWYSICAYAVADGIVLTEYTVDDSVSHVGAIKYAVPWVLPDDNDYYATVATNVRLPNGLVAATCTTDTVNVFEFVRGDSCAIEPRGE